MVLSPIYTAVEAGMASPPEDAARLFHGRGQSYPGLAFINIDWFDPVLWVVIYGEVVDEMVADIEGELARIATGSSCVS